MRRRLEWVLLVTISLTAVAMLFFEFSSVDLWLQDRFFDFERSRWLVDRNEPVGRALFYNGPKLVIYAIALTAIALLVAPGRWRSRLEVTRRRLGVALLALLAVPLFASVGKGTLNVYCPYEIRRYGGDMPYLKVLDQFPPGHEPARRGGCWPAGHASGGFALLGFAALWDSRRWRAGILVLSLGFGWWMGLYQMLKGAHYLSHTVMTMMLSWIVVLALWRLLLPPGLVESKLAAEESPQG